MSDPPALPNDQAGPLSQADWQQLADALQRGKTFRRASAIANFNLWTAGILAVLSAILALVEPRGLIFAVALGLISFNEYQGRRRLRQFDPRGLRLLGANQLFFIVLVCMYGLWQIHQALNNPNPYAGQLGALAGHPHYQKMMLDIGDLSRLVTVVVYAVLITAVATVQGINATYYFTRRKLMIEHLAVTPAWILALQKACL